MTVLHYYIIYLDLAVYCYNINNMSPYCMCLERAYSAILYVGTMKKIIRWSPHSDAQIVVYDTPSRRTANGRRKFCFRRCVDFAGRLSARGDNCCHYRAK